MRDEHIIEILDSAPVGSLSADQLAVVQSHSQKCLECGNAYQAAMLSSLAIRERAQVAIEPTPFFQTRVMAALRERQAVENVPAWQRLWKSAGALVSSMAMTTVALAALSFAVPTPLTSPSEQAVTAYSAESVILDQGSEDQMSYEQVLSTIYAEEDEAK
jgi:hypothetical protein